MLTCIACSKQQQLVDAGEDTARGAAASTKPAVKSLTSQIKDVVLKLSGAYRQSKSGGAPSSSKAYRKGGHQSRSYVADYDSTSELGGGGGDSGGGVNGGGWGANGECYPYIIGRGGSSSSTPAWDFTCVSDPGKFSRFEAWIPGVDTMEGGCYEPPVMVEEEDVPKEWVAQVEPGVHITFLSLPHGGNDLKRIRFTEMFNKWQAQRWWGENYDRILELYNVQRFNRQAMPTPPRSEDERELTYSRMGSTRESTATPPFGNVYNMTTTFNNININNNLNNCNRAPAGVGGNIGGKEMFHPAPDPTEYFFSQYQNNNIIPGWASVEVARTTTSSRDEASVSNSNASDMLEVTEWVEQDEPGVFITIRQMADGTRDLRRVRFSRERFGEVNAKQWWEENRERIHAQYL